MSVFLVKVEKSIVAPKASGTERLPLRSWRKTGASVASMTNAPPMYCTVVTLVVGVAVCTTGTLGKVGYDSCASAPVVVSRVQKTPLVPLQLAVKRSPVLVLLLLVLSIWVTGVTSVLVTAKSQPSFQFLSR